MGKLQVFAKGTIISGMFTLGCMVSLALRKFAYPQVGIKLEPGSTSTKIEHDMQEPFRSAFNEIEAVTGAPTSIVRAGFREPIPGTPYQYDDEVDLRYIVIVYNRPKSLSNCLRHLNKTILGKNDRAAVEIWLDRGKDGQLDEATLKVARDFRWHHGAVRVHVWPRHVGIYGQWIDTWRPPKGSAEIAVIVEDDVDISPYAYKYLRAARQFFGGRPDISDIGLNDEDVVVSEGPMRGKPLKRPMKEIAFLYPITASWGMSPVGDQWRGFQDWFHNVTRNGSKAYHPYVPGADLQTGWYKQFEKKNTQDSMWTLWYIHYCYLYNKSSLLPNLRAVGGKSLSRHRAVKGLHTASDQVKVTEPNLLKNWKSEFEQFPSQLIKYNYNGGIYKRA